MKEKYLKYFDLFLLIGVAVVTIVSATLDILDIKEPNYSIMAFALLTAITVHLITVGFIDLDLFKKNQE